jgi:hypothetical protein
MTGAVVVLYLAAIVAANLLVVWLGAAVSIVNALVLIGLDLTCRDLLHDRWAGRGLWWRMGLLIVTGSALSAVLNVGALRIALASCVSFGLAGAADALIYGRLAGRSRLVRVNVSNGVAAAIDSVVFSLLAFGPGVALLVAPLQWLVKCIGGAVWSLVLTSKGKGTGYRVQGTV